MESLAFAFTVITAALVGVGTYLYNDGHEHRLAGRASVIAGGIAFGIGALAKMLTPPDQYPCAAGECEGNPAALRAAVLEGLGITGALTDLALVLLFGGLGFGVAMLTRRKPPDGRRPTLLPPD